MFPYVDPWEVALWAVASYLAVVSLVRLMIFHRHRLVSRFREQLQSERRRQQTHILARKRRVTAMQPADGRLETNPSIHRHD